MKREALAVVVLTPEQLEELVERAVKKAIRELDEPPAQPQPTDRVAPNKDCEDQQARR